MTKGLKLRKGFSFDEAILMANFSKDAYDIFQHDDGTIDDSEIKKIYAALHHNRGWQAVSTIRNDDTNIRGLILKNTQSSSGHQYVISFRGSIVSDLGAVELTDFTADFDWELIRYGSLSNQRAKVVQGFHIAFESVADQIQFFFQTIRGELKPSDFRRLNELPPLRKFASITALADAASIRLGAEFEKEVQDLIQQVVADGEVDDDEELKKILKFLEDELLSKLTPLAEPLELWITGHSLGGCLCQLAGLFLRRYFGPEEAGGLRLKVYALASPKIGNQGFIDFYNEQVGEELSYRIENTLDGTPKFPYDPPFPLSLIAPEGLRIGNTFIGNYANGGEAFLVTGLGSQSGSLSFGGIVELPINVPFPHSVETYIQLLKEQKHYWYQLIRPIKDIIRPFLLEILKDEEITNVEPSEDVSGLNSHEKSLGNPEASSVN